MHIDYGSFASLSGGDIGMLAAQYQPKFLFVLYCLFILDIKRWCILLIDPLPVLSGGDSGMLAAQYQPKFSICSLLIVYIGYKEVLHIDY